MTALSESQICPTCDGFGRIPAGDRSTEELREQIMERLRTPGPRMARALARIERERGERDGDDDA